MGKVIGTEVFLARLEINPGTDRYPSTVGNPTLSIGGKALQ